MSLAFGEFFKIKERDIAGADGSSLIDDVGEDENDELHEFSRKVNISICCSPIPREDLHSINLCSNIARSPTELFLKSIGKCFSFKILSTSTVMRSAVEK